MTLFCFLRGLVGSWAKVVFVWGDILRTSRC